MFLFRSISGMFGWPRESSSVLLQDRGYRDQPVWAGPPWWVFVKTGPSHAAGLVQAGNEREFQDR